MNKKSTLTLEEATAVLLKVEEAADRILGSTSREEEFQDLYDDGFPLDGFAREKDRKDFIAFCVERGYEVS